MNRLRLSFKWNPGNYMNYCTVCHLKFTGHKMQRVCELCCIKSKGTADNKTNLNTGYIVTDGTTRTIQFPDVSVTEYIHKSHIEELIQELEKMANNEDANLGKYTFLDAEEVLNKLRALINK